MDTTTIRGQRRWQYVSARLRRLSLQDPFWSILGLERIYGIVTGNTKLMVQSIAIGSSFDSSIPINPRTVVSTLVHPVPFIALSIQVDTKKKLRKQTIALTPLITTLHASRSDKARADYWPTQY